MTAHERVRRIARTAIKEGILKKQPCGVCGDKNTQAHHDDYSKPLEVRWLCRLHHIETHGWRMADRTSVEIEIANTADSYAEIGDRFGISRERVRQIAKAMGAPARPRVYARVDGKFARAMA